jgi:hypothetical protein
MSDRASLYRVHAAECIKAAETAPDLEGKQAFLDMATAWLILAEQADKSSEGRAMGPVQADEKKGPEEEQRRGRMSTEAMKDA